MLAFVSREPRAQVGGESSGTCVAFDRRRYTLPTIKRGLEEASMRKLLALILLSCAEALIAVWRESHQAEQSGNALSKHGVRHAIKPAVQLGA